MLLSVPLFAQTIGLPVLVGDNSIGASGTFNANPVVAVNGGTFVVAWQKSAGIVVGRLERSGGFTESGSIPTALFPYVRALVAAGDGFLLIYTTNGGNAVVRLNARGELIGAPRIFLPGYFASAASNGRDVLVINELGDAVILSATGSTMRSGIRVSASDPYETRGWARAASGDRFLITWVTTANQLFATTLTADGQIVHDNVLIATMETIAGSLSAASDGARFLVAWRNVFAAGALVVNSDASPAGPPLVIPKPSSGYQVEVAWSGIDYLALLDDTTRLHRVRISADGALVGDDVVVQESNVTHDAPRLAVDGSDVLMVWMSGSYCNVSPPLGERGGIEINAAWVGRAPQTLSPGLPDDIEPVVAAGAVSPLVIWNEVRERGLLRAAMVDGAARLLSLPQDPLIDAAVASNGSGYLAAYLSTSTDCLQTMVIESIDAGGRLVSRSVAGKGTSFVGSTYPQTMFKPSVAWNGGEYLVAWQDANAIVAVRVSATGELIDRSPVTLITTSEPGMLTARLAWASNRWFVVWLRSYLPYIPFYPGPPTENVISMRTFNRDLQLLAGGMVLASHGYSPAVASDGVNAMIAWRDVTAVHAVHLDKDGYPGLVVDAPLFRGQFGTSFSAAYAGGRFYVLDLDRLFVFDGASLRAVTQLPGSLSSSDMTSDGTQPVVAWSATVADLRRVFVARVNMEGGRRRAVRTATNR